MKQEIEWRLQPLVGQPLSHIPRSFGGIQAFEFGDLKTVSNRHGETITRADWSLHVSCRWVISAPSGTILSSESRDGEDSALEEPGNDAQGAHDSSHWFYGLLGDTPPAVQAIEADEEGGLRIRMSGDYTLDIQPDEESDEPEEDAEQWRFLPKEARDAHLVITYQGIEQ